MDVMTVLPLIVVLGLLWFVVRTVRRRERAAAEQARREQAFLASLPPRTVRDERTDALALLALARLCALTGNTPGTFADMSGYFREQGWNSADVLHVMGRLEDLGFAHQVITATHPISPYRYRATAEGVRKNMDRYGTEPAAPGIVINQTTTTGNNNAAAAASGAGAAHASAHQTAAAARYEDLARTLREEAADAPQEQADPAESHADALDAALAAGDEGARDRAVDRVRRFLLTAGPGFEATRQLLALLSA
ncbi:hypothetical protein ACIQUQ_28340 [Streptomyces sp. NPDC101118]|uniref:hypothetical protein n=1 Tax=Streptomyces sp. NPDC101118 TaxID=3366109 RepID=UPI0037F20280